MAHFAVFSPGGARKAPILKVRQCPAEDWMLQFGNLPADQRAIEVEAEVTPETHMMVRRPRTGWDAEPRPVLDVTLSKETIRADDRDAAVLSGLPVPCTVSIDPGSSPGQAPGSEAGATGATYEVKDGELRITSPMPAIYEIVIDHWPYQRWAATLAVVAVADPIPNASGPPPAAEAIPNAALPPPEPTAL